MVFSFIGSASLYVATVALAPPPNVVMAAFANGLSLGIVSALRNAAMSQLSAIHSTADGLEPGMRRTSDIWLVAYTHMLMLW